VAWLSIREGGSEWLIDEDGIDRILRSFATRQAMLDNAKEKHESQGAILPTITSLEVDWPRVYHQRDQRLVELETEYQSRLLLDGPSALRCWLVELAATTRSMTGTFLARQRAATDATMGSIRRMEVVHEGVLTALKGVRDTSASVLVVGAVFLSGGAAAAALGAGAGLTGVGKGQDTGSIEQGVVAAGKTILTGAVGMKGVGMAAKGAAYVFTIAASGIASYQETHSVGSALIRANTDLILMAIGAGPKGSSAVEKATIFVVSTGFGAVGTALEEGASAKREKDPTGKTIGFVAGEVVKKILEKKIGSAASGAGLEVAKLLKGSAAPGRFVIAHIAKDTAKKSLEAISKNAAKGGTRLLRGHAHAHAPSPAQMFADGADADELFVQQTAVKFSSGILPSACPGRTAGPLGVLVP
jgi:hypothetical protein